MLKVNANDRLVQLWLDVVEESQLPLGHDRVERAEAQAEQAVHLRFLGEACRNRLRGLDRLRIDHQAADGEVVGVNIAARSRAVSILNSPRVVGEQLRCRRFARRVQALAANLAGRQVAGKDPEIRRARVEIEIQRLGWRANCDGRDPGNIPGWVDRDCRSSSRCSLGLGRFLFGGKGVDGLDKLLGHFGAILEVCLVCRERAAEVRKLGIAHLFD